MSVFTYPKEEDLISADALRSLATGVNIKIPEDEIEDFRILISSADTAAKTFLAAEDYIPRADLQRYPRTNVHIPDDTDKGGWATKATVISTQPSSELLRGRSLALKDNIALADVRCTNGTAAMDWTAVVDATVVTRILDAHGTIAGKAACENNCFGVISDTSVTGPVHNPYADGYSCGGSSSGCARLVASGQVEMALGCDQGGSIRVPAANCGLVGLKPTWGLVPYTGIISLEATIDHVGPMTKNALDSASLLDVISGYDGFDDRVPYLSQPGRTDYASAVEDALASPVETALKGKKVGILLEGFQSEKQDPNITKLVRSAAMSFQSLGAEVDEVSIPMHMDAALLWSCYMPTGALKQGFLASMTGRKQLFMTDRTEKAGAGLSQEAFDALGAGGENIYLRGVFLEAKYGPTLHARTSNAVRKLTVSREPAVARSPASILLITEQDEYEKALKEYDILVMPTTPVLPAPLSTGPQKPLAKLSRAAGVLHNTAGFNLSGHPALSVPVGFASPGGSSVKLPVGMQLVGGKYQDQLLLQAAALWERGQDWKGIAAN
ncbi:amidase signature domain-containing protein [Xylariomycetidae sp. FL2044]|nr:amidase signature domain-containing protein [Xylariomycetidae sp. FL2044]